MVWRIQDRATFEALRRSGRRARRGPVTVTYAAVRPAPEPRVAYAVGKRVGKAVVRNRLRRQLRAAVAGMTGWRPAPIWWSAEPGARDFPTKI